MAKFAEEARRYSHVVKNEYAPETGYNRDVVTYSGAAHEIVAGTVLGKTALETEYGLFADGDVDVVVALEEKSAELDTPVQVLALVRGPADVSSAGLLTEVGVTVAEVHAALEAKGVRVLPAV